MYILISGTHPLFDKSNHQYNDYVEVLKQAPKIQFPEELGFTKLSADLLSWMLDYKETNRFNADQCLKHPWITRQNISKFPETMVELH